jgi:hypothetical protein
MKTTTAKKTELDMGQHEEMEHTDNPKVARKMAAVHVRKDPQYYEKLDIAESASLPQLKRLLRRKHASD